VQHVFIRDRAGDFPVTPVDTSIVDALMNPTAYEHPVDTVELIETHISWLLLAGDYAYKIKKPIALDFLDFSRLERRKFFCNQKKIRLNQPFAPEIYLDVVPITLENGRPHIGGKNAPIEYAVRMRRFDQALRLDTQLERGDLSVTDMLELARNIAARHAAAQVIDESQRDIVVTRTREFIWDIAFLVMDLVARQRHDLAAHFLNRYLESTGDYDSMKVLSLYFVYRCLVLAKVATILSQEHEPDADPEANLSEVHSYCEMAKRQIALRTPILIVMCGLSGSGKTRVSGEVMAAIPAIRIRSDIERKRMFGLSEHEDSASDLGKGLYTQQTSHAVYAHLLRTAQMILESGHSVILDAAFLREENRVAAVRVAQDCGCFPILLQVLAPHDILRDRIRQRIAYANDASEAGLDVLQQQIENAEPLSPEERQRVIVCDNSGSLDISTIVSRIVKMADSGRSMNARR